MSESFHPLPRICERPSGKIKKAAQTATAWSLPTRGAEFSGPGRSVECFACRKFSTVPAGAVSARCSHCSAYIGLDDLALRSGTHRRAVSTWGAVTVMPGADLKGLNIECKELTFNGRGSGNFFCHGVCRIKTDQHISGTVNARRLVLEKKAHALVTGGVHVVNAIVHGVLEATLYAEDTVTIHRHAKVLGDIVASRLIVQEGGVHHGNFSRPQ